MMRISGYDGKWTLQMNKFSLFYPRHSKIPLAWLLLGSLILIMTR